MHRTDDRRSVIELVVAHYHKGTFPKFFHADAAFANPRVYDFLEAQAFFYTIRLRSNRVSEGSILHLLQSAKRPLR